MPAQKTKGVTLGIIGEGDGADLYITARNSGIDFLCIVVDCLPLTFLGRSKKPWLRVSRVLRWHQDELQYTRDPKVRAKRQVMIRRLSEALRQYKETGHVHIDPEPD